MRISFADSEEVQMARGYLSTTLGSGLSLAKASAAGCDFDSGDFFSLVSAQCDPERALSFRSGGLAGGDYGRSRMNRIGDSDELLANEIVEFCAGESQRICVVEDLLSRPSDKALKEKRVVFLGNEVYHVFSHGDSEVLDVCRRFRAARTSPEAGLFFTSIQEPYPGPFSETPSADSYSGSILALVEELRAIAVGAYDGEGFLFWERRR